MLLYQYGLLCRKKTKKICNYLVFPNNFVLSLSLSLRLGLFPISISYFPLCAHELCRADVAGKGLSKVFFAFLYYFVFCGKGEIGKILFLQYYNETTMNGEIVRLLDAKMFLATDKCRGNRHRSVVS